MKDLPETESEMESPEWHEELLLEREERIRLGQEQFVDWEVAKAQLKRELNS